MIYQFTDQFDAGTLALALIAAVVQLALVWPGLVLFYAGLSRTKNVAQRTQQMLLQFAILGLTWTLFTYSLAFAPSWGTVPQLDRDKAAPMLSLQELMKFEDAKKDRTHEFGRGGFIGGLDYVGLQSINSIAGATGPVFPSRRPVHHLPHLAFLVLHLALFVVAPTPLLCLLQEVLSSFKAVVFAAFWGIVVYAPIAHSIWGDGWLGDWGSFDSAGGMPQIAVGGSALMLWCLLRSHSLPVVAAESEDVTSGWGNVGMLALCVGGPLVQAATLLRIDGVAASAFLNCVIACAAGIVAFAVTEKVIHKQNSPGTLGTGALCGFAAISSGSGVMIAESALIVGTVGGILGGIFASSASWLRGLHASRVVVWHGATAAVGMLLTGTFATTSVGGFHWDGRSITGLIEGNSDQLLRQLGAVGFAATWGFVGTGLCWFVLSLSRFWPGASKA